MKNGTQYKKHTKKQSSGSPRTRGDVGDGVAQRGGEKAGWVLSDQVRRDEAAVRAANHARGAPRRQPFRLRRVERRQAVGHIQLARAAREGGQGRGAVAGAAAEVWGDDAVPLGRVWRVSK